MPEQVSEMSFYEEARARGWLPPGSKNEREVQCAEFAQVVKTCKPVAKHMVKRARPSNRGLTKLFALTTIDPHGDRCLAVFDSFRKAQRIVLENVCDIWEYSYDLAVIEVIYPNGLYQYSNEQYWYRWVKASKGYKPCTRPTRYGICVGISIG